jgi:oxygen-dependent protoporphyrinogen oxidase
MSLVAVVGGGVTGLAAARRLVRSGLDVVVLEAASRWGGKLAPLWLGGVRLDAGAESLLVRRPEGLALIEDLGLSDRLVYPTPARPALLLDGSTQPLPRSVLGVPADLGGLRPILSEPGYLRAAQEPELPASPLAGDVAIGAHVDARFGQEVTERLLEPLLGGVYAGRARELSFAAVAPELYRRVAVGGSTLQHAELLARKDGGGPVFAGLIGGVSTVIDAITRDLADHGVLLRTGVTVRVLDRDQSRFRLSCGPVPSPETIMADGVLLAVPASPAARLLAPIIGSAAELAGIGYASVAVITLVVRGLAERGSGLLVPPGELPTIKALTYSGTKWAWVAAQAAAVWGEAAEVVRVSVGRVGETGALQLADPALLERTFAEAGALPGWERAELITGVVSRWGGSLPQFAVGHPDLVRRLRSAIEAVPGLAVAGAAYDGVGIAACLGSAASAADKITADLAGGSHGRIGA